MKTLQRIRNAKSRVTSVTTETTGSTSNHPENIWARHMGSTKSRNYRQQPYWALHTHFGKC